MTEYYLDFETQGTNPENHKIITIQFQRVDTKTGRASGNLEILKEWELSESEMLERFLSRFHSEHQWGFVPIGFNLRFELLFLRHRAKSVMDRDLNLDWLYYEQPWLDIKPVLIMINSGQFSTTLDCFVKKSMDHSKVPIWYEKSMYDKIIDYIKDETKRFLHAYQFLKLKLPVLGNEYIPLSHPCEL